MESEIAHIVSERIQQVVLSGTLVDLLPNEELKVRQLFEAIHENSNSRVKSMLQQFSGGVRARMLPKVYKEQIGRDLSNDLNRFISAYCMTQDEEWSWKFQDMIVFMSSLTPLLYAIIMRSDIELIQSLLRHDGAFARSLNGSMLSDTDILFQWNALDWFELLYGCEHPLFRSFTLAESALELYDFGVHAKEEGVLHLPVESTPGVKTVCAMFPEHHRPVSGTNYFRGTIPKTAKRRIAVVVPFYNEEGVELKWVLRSLAEQSKALDPAEYDIHVLLIMDGYKKCSSSMLAYLRALFPANDVEEERVYGQIDGRLLPWWHGLEKMHTSGIETRVVDRLLLLKGPTKEVEKKEEEEGEEDGKRRLSRVMGPRRGNNLNEMDEGVMDYSAEEWETIPRCVGLKKNRKKHRGKHTDYNFLKVTLLVKADNRRKHNSHEWFFGAAGFVNWYNPDYCFATDCGTQFAPNCLVHLIKALDDHPRWTACTGRQRVMTARQQESDERMFISWGWWLRALQGFDFESSFTGFTGAFALLGFLPVIPGPCGLYRYEGIKGKPLEWYFDVVNQVPDASWSGLVLGNLKIAEDRILTYSGVLMAETGPTGYRRVADLCRRAAYFVYFLLCMCACCFLCGKLDRKHGRHTSFFHDPWDRLMAWAFPEKKEERPGEVLLEHMYEEDLEDLQKVGYFRDVTKPEEEEEVEGYAKNPDGRKRPPHRFEKDGTWESSAWIGLVPEAVFYFQSEDNLKSLALQRRRWINGTLAGYVYLGLFQWHLILRAKMSLFRAVCIYLLLMLQVYTYTIVTLSPSIFLAMLYANLQSIAPHLTGLTQPLGVFWLVLVLIYVLFVLVHMKYTFVRAFFALMNFINVFILGAIFVGIIATIVRIAVEWIREGNSPDEFAVAFYIFSFALLLCLMCFPVCIACLEPTFCWSSIRHMFMWFIPYYALLPTLVAWFGAYSIARTFDLSWGNRPTDGGAESTAADQQQDKIKSLSRTFCAIVVFFNIMVLVAVIVVRIHFIVTIGMTALFFWAAVIQYSLSFTYFFLRFIPMLWGQFIEGFRLLKSYLFIEEHDQTPLVKHYLVRKGGPLITGVLGMQSRIDPNDDEIVDDLVVLEMHEDRFSDSEDDPGARKRSVFSGMRPQQVEDMETLVTAKGLQRHVSQKLERRRIRRLVDMAGTGENASDGVKPSSRHVFFKHESKDLSLSLPHMDMGNSPSARNKEPSVEEGVKFSLSTPREVRSQIVRKSDKVMKKAEEK